LSMPLHQAKNSPPADESNAGLTENDFPSTESSSPLMWRDFPSTKNFSPYIESSPLCMEKDQAMIARAKGGPQGPPFPLRRSCVKPLSRLRFYNLTPRSGASAARARHQSPRRRFSNPARLIGLSRRRLRMS